MELMENKKHTPLTLQFFADGAENGSEGQEAEADKPADLNGLLAGDAALQSQFDKLVGKALQTARGKWEREQGMNARELAQEQQREWEHNLRERELALQSRELLAGARETLSRKGLPLELAACLPLSGEDAMRDGLDAVERAYRDAVQKGVAERLRSAAPASGTSSAAVNAQVRAAMGLK